MKEKVITVEAWKVVLLAGSLICTYILGRNMGKQIAKKEISEHMDGICLGLKVAKDVYSVCNTSEEKGNEENE